MDVLNYLERTGTSTTETAVVFNIPSDSTVWKWKQLFDTGGIDALQPKSKGASIMKKKEQKNQPVPGSLEALQVENKRLRMENAYLKKVVMWLASSVNNNQFNCFFKAGNERNLIFIITRQSVYKI
ncbi:hypothetical protein GCM10020331_100420 [Ectobacillus funiculus]